MCFVPLAAEGPRALRARAVHHSSRASEAALGPAMNFAPVLYSQDVLIPFRSWREFGGTGCYFLGDRSLFFPPPSVSNKTSTHSNACKLPYPGRSERLSMLLNQTTANKAISW